MMSFSSFVSFTRVPIRKKQPTRERVIAWLLGLATQYVKRGKKIPRWIDTSGLLYYSLGNEFGSLEITKWNEEYLFEPTKFVFLDFINIEDAESLVDNLLSLRKQGDVSTGIFNDREQKVRVSIKNISSSYKTIASGGILSFKPSSPRFDFIESIGVSYQKTEQSFIVLKFTVRTTKLFNDSYSNYLKGENFTEKFVARFNINNIFSKTKSILDVGYSLKSPAHNINDLLDSLNIQVKSVLRKSLKDCITIKNKEAYLPCIAIYKYKYSEFNEYKSEFRERSGIGYEPSYSDEEGNVNISWGSNDEDNRHQTVHILMDIKQENELGKSNFYTINVLADKYIDYLANYCIMSNYIKFIKNDIARIRTSMYKYLREKKDSVYLTKAASLKREIIQYWIILKRIYIDADSNLQRNQLKFYKIEKLSINKRFEKYTKYTTLDSLVESSVIENTKDVINNCKDIIELFQQTSNDEVINSNMLIQKRVILLTVVSILASVYGANKDWTHQTLIYIYKNLGELYLLLFI